MNADARARLQSGSGSGLSIKSAFVPNLLLALAVVASLSVQAAYLVAEHRQLGASAAESMSQEESATKVRAALDALASATATLADAGNTNARAIVERLRSRGVTIRKPDASAAVPPRPP